MAVAAESWEELSMGTAYVRPLVHEPCRHARHCHVWPWLVEFSGVVPTCFMLSLATISTTVSPIKPEDSPISVQGFKKKKIQRHVSGIL